MVVNDLKELPMATVEDALKLLLKGKRRVDLSEPEYTVTAYFVGNLIRIDIKETK